VNKKGKDPALFGSTGGQHPFARFVDHLETYAPHIIEKMVAKIGPLGVVADLGAGSGRDLSIVRRLHPRATLIAVEGGIENARILAGIADQVCVANIERDRRTRLGRPAYLTCVISRQMRKKVVSEMTRCDRVRPI